jgi:hypothetical protein
MFYSCARGVGGVTVGPLLCVLVTFVPHRISVVLDALRVRSSNSFIKSDAFFMSSLVSHIASSIGYCDEVIVTS